MPLLTWSKENSVGVAELDAQHMKIFALVNDLYDGIKELKTKDKIDVILEELSAYVTVHFATEDTYFQKFTFEVQKNTDDYTHYI